MKSSIIKKYAEKHGYTALTLARRLRVSIYTAESWFCGRNRPSRKNEIKLCKLFGLPMPNNIF